MDALGVDDPTQIGPYVLVGCLGAGGMGKVYLGRSRAGREVAVKVIRAELATDDDFRRRFAAEFDAARRVSGLYTAAVVDGDPMGEPPWLATIYIAAPSLHSAVTAHGPIPAEDLPGLAAGLAESLSSVHAAGLVHRDLKPSNVLLAPDGPRVIDFGIAKAVEAADLTRTGTVLGSPGFMSPEQASGDPIGPASDVFSLGSVLAYAASGNPPFGEGTAPALLYRVVHSEPELRGLPDDLRALVRSCLEKDPARRPTVEQILVELTGRGNVPERSSPDPVPPSPPAAPTVVAAEAATEPPPTLSALVDVPVGPGRNVGRQRRRIGAVALAAVAGIAVAVVMQPWAGSGAGAGADAGSATGSLTRSASDSRAAGGAGSASDSSGAPSPSPTPEPSLCEDLLTTLASSANSYAPGEQPTFALSIVNTGTTDCFVDVSARRLTLFVTVPSTLEQIIWSSQTCDHDTAKPDVHVLTAGQGMTVSLTWPRQSRSLMSCTAGSPVAAGQYGARILLDDHYGAYYNSGRRFETQTIPFTLK